MEALSSFLESAETSLLVWFGIFVRVAATAFLLPGIGERAVPSRIKLGGAVALSLVVAPMVLGSMTELTPSLSGIGRIVTTEAMAGLFIGISIRLMIFVVQIAGTIAAQSLSVSQMFGGVAGPEPEPIISTLLTLAVITLALNAGLHVKVALALAASYEIAPFGLALSSADLGHWASASGSAVFTMAIGLALPFIVLSFVYNLSLGAINRAMPQLMVAFVGAPAIVAMGIGLLLLVLPVILHAWLDQIDIVLLNPFEVMP
jgi:flagellar biosynthetic protein FliR